MRTSYGSLFQARRSVSSPAVSSPRRSSVIASTERQRGVVGVGGDAFGGDRARLVVAPVARQRLGHEREERAVARPHRQRGVARGFVAGAIVEQQRGGRRDARRARVARVRAA